MPPRLLALLLVLLATARAEDGLVFRGSVAVKPAIDAAAAAFAVGHPGFTLSSAGSTSDVSIQAVAAGEAQLGALVKDPTPEQIRLFPGLRTVPVALDGLVIVVNAANPVTNLTRSQVADLFTGGISTWELLEGGEPLLIEPVARLRTLATSAFFGTCFNLEYEEVGDGVDRRMRHRVRGAKAWGTARALISADHDKGLAQVSLSRQAVTYAPYAIARAQIGRGARLKMLRLEGVEATPASIRDGTYPATRTCLLLTRGEPTGLLREFVDYLRSPEGQRVIEAADFVALK